MFKSSFSLIFQASTVTAVAVTATGSPFQGASGTLWLCQEFAIENGY
jgi:hypothetical protein